MGCLFTKDTPLQYSSHAPRQIHVHKAATNGSVFTNGPETQPRCKTVNRDDIDGRLHDRDDPPHTSQSHVLSPRPLETLPPTPEDERPSLHVQYAEDLEPVTPLPDVITVATIRPKTNRVDVSSVSFNPTEPGRKHNTMLSNNDVTIEDLDSELDHYSKFSQPTFPNQPQEKPEPINTGGLLPRRKKQHDDSADIDKRSADEPIKSKKKKRKSRKPKENPKHISATRPENLDIEITDLNDDVLVIGDEKSDIQSNVKYGDNDATKITEPEQDEAEHTGATCDNNVSVSSAKSPDSTSQPVLQEVYQKELEKERLKRKRKHNQHRKQISATRNITSEAETRPEEELKLGLKARPIPESRPGSSTSVWTLESAFSLKSQDSRFNVYPSTSHDNVTSPSKSRDGSPASRFSYVPSGTTPISFKQDRYEHEAQLVDLETEFEADERTGDSVVVTARVMDPFHGIKPYRTEDEVLGKTPLEDIQSSSSTSYHLMKQKLLYSRFARRPTSETRPRMEGKPPLPPGTSLRMRPSSDTDRGHMSFSRYFTTDLDIH